MNDPEKAWTGRARALCRKVNVARWLDVAAVPVVVAAGVSAAMMMVVRIHFPDADGVWLYGVAVALPCGALAWAWLRARRGFLGIDAALVRLEVRHGLHAALSTARAGAGAWPPPPHMPGDGLRWRPVRTGVPPLLAVALVTTAWLLPVAARQNVARVSEPAAWSMVETDLRTMVEERLVDEPGIRETRDAIRQLRSRPQGEWFNHSSIEAGDRILLAHKSEMAALENRMRDAARALRDAAAALPGIQPEQGNHGGLFDEILQGLRTGGLRPDQEMLEKLSELAGANGGGLNQIDPQQLADMLDQLQRNARRLAEMRERLQGMPGMGDGGEEQGNGECEGEGAQGNEGQGDEGRGGVARGPGEGGTLFGDERDEVDATRAKPLPAGDLSRAVPGDLIGTGGAQHDIDEAVSPELRTGGAPVRPGDGGGAVWSDTLHPSEQEALRKYFD